MRLRLLLVMLLCACSSHPSAISDEKRTIQNQNIGAITISVPKDWALTERTHIQYGTTFYRLTPPANDFDLEILFNDLPNMKMGALVDKDLEIYIESNLGELASQSTEGKVKAIRFGKARDAVYARLTDKAPKPGEYRYITQGVRLLGNNVVLFTFMSNDRQGDQLKHVLKIVDSVAIKSKI
jgi:hypothetical protein